jgi:hypothetical protein
MVQAGAIPQQGAALLRFLSQRGAWDCRYDAADVLFSRPALLASQGARAGIFVALSPRHPLPPEPFMHSPLLHRLFSRALRASLATPLVLAGCGGVDLTGYAYPACDGGELAVSGLSPSEQTDFVQLRRLVSNF